MSNAVSLIAIALAWGLYGLIHSWLAGNRTKNLLIQRWPALHHSYRLLYNLQAVVLSIPPLALTWLYPGEPLWHWPAWIAWTAFLITVAGFLWSMRWYDGLDFLGLRQLRSRHHTLLETLILSPLHRYVRHPWYSLGLLYLWTRDLNAGWLVASLAITLYIVIGSRLEERKLEQVFGEPYRRYMERVPGLLPWPGRSLRREEAETLVRESYKDTSSVADPD
jgi:protein-S-isoprenylcysteine O-methyltransferase Ste14